MARRPVAPELVERLHAAIMLERIAGSHEQQQRAIAATSLLLFAARKTGWRPSELAAATGTNRWTVARRTRTAAAAHGDHESGLAVPPPPPPPAQREVPLAEREWLRAGEVCALLGVAPATLAQWRTEGLTPAAELRNGRWWFPREDVQRIAAAPRRGRAGVDRRAVRGQIEQP